MPSLTTSKWLWQYHLAHHGGQTTDFLLFSSGSFPALQHILAVTHEYQFSSKSDFYESSQLFLIKTIGHKDLPLPISRNACTVLWFSFFRQPSSYGSSLFFLCFLFSSTQTMPFSSYHLYLSHLFFPVPLFVSSLLADLLLCFFSHGHNFHRLHHLLICPLSTRSDLESLTHLLSPSHV